MRSWLRMTDAARRSEAAPPGARVTSTLSAGGAGLDWGRRGVVIALTDNARPKRHFCMLFTLRPAAPKVFTHRVDRPAPISLLLPSRGICKFIA